MPLKRYGGKRVMPSESCGEKLERLAGDIKEKIEYCGRAYGRKEHIRVLAALALVCGLFTMATSAGAEQKEPTSSADMTGARRNQTYYMVDSCLACEVPRVFDTELADTMLRINGYAVEQSADTTDNSVYVTKLTSVTPVTPVTDIEQKAEQPRGPESLFGIGNPDSSYKSVSVRVTGKDRDVLERLVMGEAGNQGFEGAALVAQCIRDAMVYDGYGSVEEVRKTLKYSGSLEYEPSQDVLDAVEYIFDQGNCAVEHRILYFYSANGGWHETQNFIIQYKAHRFFDRWN